MNDPEIDPTHSLVLDLCDRSTEQYQDLARAYRQLITAAQLNNEIRADIAYFNMVVDEIVSRSKQIKKARREAARNGDSEDEQHVGFNMKELKLMGHTLKLANTMIADRRKTVLHDVSLCLETLNNPKSQQRELSDAQKELDSIDITDLESEFDITL